MYSSGGDVGGGDVGSGGGCACVGAKGVWNLSVSSARFCCEPKLL